MNHRRNLLLAIPALFLSPSLLAGSWSYESFANDGALDWVGDFSDEPTPEFIRRTLVPATSGEYVESYVGQAAIAAAEFVAASLGYPCQGFPKELLPLVAELREQVRSLTPLAQAAVAGVLGTQSELRQSWSLHAEDLAIWVASVQELQARLSKTAA